jgi:hypothetical protein
VGIGSTHHFSLQNSHFVGAFPPNFPRSVSQHLDDFPLTRRACRRDRARARTSPSARRIDYRYCLKAAAQDSSRRAPARDACGRPQQCEGDDDENRNCRPEHTTFPFAACHSRNHGKDCPRRSDQEHDRHHDACVPSHLATITRDPGIRVRPAAASRFATTIKRVTTRRNAVLCRWLLLSRLQAIAPRLVTARTRLDLREGTQRMPRLGTTYASAGA